MPVFSTSLLHRPFLMCDFLSSSQILAAVGETFETPLRPISESEKPEHHEPMADLITGVILSTRLNFYRLAIWTRYTPGPDIEDAKDDLLKRITMIGKHFKTSILGFGEDEQLMGGYRTEVEWIKHSDSEKKDKKVSSWVRTRFCLSSPSLVICQTE